MALYRVLKRLGRGKGKIIEPGTLSRLEWLGERPDDIQRLIAVGAVAEVAPPPLAVLPGWELRSEKLVQCDVIHVVHLLEANAELLAEKVGVQPRTIHKWQREAEECLLAPRRD
jgi:hypothetical protein